MASTKLLTPGEVYRSMAYRRGGLNRARLESYEYFDDNYFNKGNYNKKLIPGGIYTFNYDPISKDILDFYDKRPIIISLKSDFSKNTNNWIETGINLNFLPYREKIQTLDVLYTAYSKKIEDNIDREEEDPERLFFLEKDYMKILNSLIYKIAKTEYKFAIRNYIFTRMKNKSKIEYEDWGLVPLINSETLMGLSLNEVHKEYKNFKKEYKKKRKK